MGAALESIRCCGRRQPLAETAATPSSSSSSTSLPPRQASGSQALPLLQKGNGILRGDGREPSQAKPASGSDPNRAADAGALKDLGNSHFKKGEHEKAYDAYSNALELRPEDATVWLNRSIAGRQLKRWESSFQDASKAVELMPSNVKGHYSKAYALHKLGKTMKALEAITVGQVQHQDNKALKDLEAEILKASPEVLKMYKQAGIAGEHLKDIPLEPKAERKVVHAANSTEASCPSSQLPSTDSEVKATMRHAKAAMYEWKGRNPSNAERDCFKYQLVSMFREKYVDLKAQAAAHKAKKSSLNTDQYGPEKKLGLQLKGGHQPMDRPEGIKIPDTYGSAVGTLTPEQLATYGPDNAEGRIFVSVYGDIFDVSDRPDKYGAEGPYKDLTGKDITWGLFTGVDTPEMCNRFYDLFKAKDMGVDKLAGVCSWLAWYETEYGKPIGRLTPYESEGDLPVPPLEEVDAACVVM